MSARDEVLGAVRRALGRSSKAQVPERLPRSTKVEADLLALFVARVEDYRATVARCTPNEVEAEIARALGERSAILPPALPWRVANGIVDAGQSADELDRIDAVVTAARAGIALTGTIVLDHGPDQGRRALSLVPDLHVCVVSADQVVAGVPEAVALLDPHRVQTWISGPSATSDIELSRVEGVHGPRGLHVVVID